MSAATFERERKDIMGKLAKNNIPQRNLSNGRGSIYRRVGNLTPLGGNYGIPKGNSNSTLFDWWPALIKITPPHTCTVDQVNGNPRGTHNYGNTADPALFIGGMLCGPGNLLCPAAADY